MTRRAVGVAGLVLHVLVGVVPFAATSVVAPVWAAIVLALWWAVLAGVAVKPFRRKPVVTPGVPLITLAMWAAVVAIGERVVGWDD